MVAAVETMAYAGEVPWHGLGVKVVSMFGHWQRLKNLLKYFLEMLLMLIYYLLILIREEKQFKLNLLQ